MNRIVTARRILCGHAYLSCIIIKEDFCVFTWNFQYISKARLAETFGQLRLSAEAGDILVRIHTAIHVEEEAVDLARFIAKLVPGAHIFGTSTSAVIGWGRLIRNQCVISVTKM